MEKNNYTYIFFLYPYFSIKYIFKFCLLLPNVTNFIIHILLFQLNNFNICKIIYFIILWVFLIFLQILINFLQTNMFFFFEFLYNIFIFFDSLILTYDLYVCIIVKEWTFSSTSSSTEFSTHDVSNKMFVIFFLKKKG